MADCKAVVPNQVDNAVLVCPECYSVDASMVKRVVVQYSFGDELPNIAVGDNLIIAEAMHPTIFVHAKRLGKSSMGRVSLTRIDDRDELLGKSHGISP